MITGYPTIAALVARSIQPGQAMDKAKAPNPTQTNPMAKPSELGQIPKDMPITAPAERELAPPPREVLPAVVLPATMSGRMRDLSYLMNSLAQGMNGAEFEALLSDPKALKAAFETRNALKEAELKARLAPRQPQIDTLRKDVATLQARGKEIEDILEKGNDFATLFIGTVVIPELKETIEALETKQKTEALSSEEFTELGEAKANLGCREEAEKAITQRLRQSGMSDATITQKTADAGKLLDEFNVVREAQDEKEGALADLSESGLDQDLAQERALFNRYVLGENGSDKEPVRPVFTVSYDQNGYCDTIAVNMMQFQPTEGKLPSGPLLVESDPKEPLGKLREYAEALETKYPGLALNRNQTRLWSDVMAPKPE